METIGLPQSGRSCSEVEGELHVPGGQIERNKVTGGVAVMAVVEYHAVRRGRFQRDGQFQPRQRRIRQSRIT